MIGSITFISFLLNVISIMFVLLFLFKKYKNKLHPEHLIKVFIKRFKKYWTMICSKKTNKTGRPPIPVEVFEIIKKMYFENTNIGGLKIWMNLKYLGYKISLSYVYQKLRQVKKEFPNKPTQKWKTFLYNSKVIAMDFTTVFIEVSKDIFKELFIFIIIDHERRKVLYYNFTFQPSQDWVVQQLKNCFHEAHGYQYMIHDRDSIFMYKVRGVLEKYFQLKSKVTSPQSPWQNPFVESFNATLKRELLSHVVLKDELHLRKLLNEYIAYYNKYRMHSGLMDSPEGLTHFNEPPQKGSLRKLKSVPVLNGLHRYYYWKDAA